MGLIKIWAFTDQKTLQKTWEMCLVSKVRSLGGKQKADQPTLMTCDTSYIQNQKFIENAVLTS